MIEEIAIESRLEPLFIFLTRYVVLAIGFVVFFFILMVFMLIFVLLCVLMANSIAGKTQ